MTAYYNEIEPYAAAWLRNLIAAGHIAPGEVDERSIVDVRADDLKGFAQCHFFAGIGVWSYALGRAGWDDDRPCWTGSCPCQSFSAAGKGQGFEDERHLWPVWFNLIRECRPPVVFGEQVEAAVNHGWLDLVQSDLERENYACGAVGFPACGIGAPHIRSRLWFVADPNSAQPGEPGGQERAGAQGIQCGDDISGCGPSGILDNTPSTRHPAPGLWPEIQARDDARLRGLESGCGDGLMGGPGGALPVNGFWRNADWLLCRDGKFRPVEPGTFPLVNGAPSRVGRLRAYGNAINAEAAEAVILSFMESRP